MTTEYPKPCCTPFGDLPVTVNVKFLQVTIGAVSSAPHLDPPLYGLHRHVLLQGSPSLVFYHRLINSLLMVGIVIYSKVSVQVSEKFSHLEKLVEIWLPTLWHFAVVTKVEVVPDLQEPVPRHYFFKFWDPQQPVR